jgi:hypothetical protein
MYLKRFFICTKILRLKIQNKGLFHIQLEIIIRYSILPFIPSNPAKRIFNTN